MDQELRQPLSQLMNPGVASEGATTAPGQVANVEQAASQSKFKILLPFKILFISILIYNCKKTVIDKESQQPLTQVQCPTVELEQPPPASKDSANENQEASQGMFEKFNS